MADTGLGYAPRPFYVKYVTFANLTAVYASCWSVRTFVTSRRPKLHAILSTFKSGSVQNAHPSPLPKLGRLSLLSSRVKQ